MATNDKIIGPWTKWTGKGYAPCPICGGEVMGTCRCMRGDSECENGHSFHVCVKHQMYVHGESDHSLSMDVCTCGKE